MSTLKKIIYKCDVCGKEFETSDKLRKVPLPCYSFESDGYTNKLSSNTFDLCIECKQKYEGVVFNHFATLGCFIDGTITVLYNKEGEEEPTPDAPTEEPEEIIPDPEIPGEELPEDPETEESGDDEGYEGEVYNQ